MYDIERIAREDNYTHEQRHSFRQEHAIAVLEELRDWIEKNEASLSPKSAISNAIKYTKSLWSRLNRYVEDGRYEIDNNRIENTIRPMAIGRKNYLFAGSHQSAQRIAVMYSLFGTCKMQGIDPYQWLHETLAKIQDHPANRLDELLPIKKVNS